MSDKELPPGWALAKLGDLLREPLRNGHSARATTDPDGIRTLNLTAVTLDEFSDKRTKITSADPARVHDLWLEPGDILIQRSNTPDLVGTAALFKGPKNWAIYPDLLIRVRLCAAIMPEFAITALRSKAARDYFRANAKGLAGSMPKIDQLTICNFRIPVPPLAEQKRIVEALEELLSRLDAAEHRANRAANRVPRLRTYLTSITYGYPVAAEEPSAPLPAPMGTDDGQLPAIPASWSWKRLGEIAEVVGGVTKDKKKQSDPTLSEVPYLRVANVQRGRLELSDISTIRVPKKKAVQLELLHGDVLLNEGGDRDKLGRGWIWEDQVPGAIHQNHVFRARITDGIILPKLLSWHANNSGRWFEVNGKQSVNLASISLSKVRQLPVPVPPRAEQEEILGRIEDQLSLLDKASVVVRQALLKAQALRKALLSRALSGNLVPQDPTDEPASVLLERIRSEQAVQPKRKYGRRARHLDAANKPGDSPPPPAASTSAPSHAVQQELPL